MLHLENEIDAEHIKELEVLQSKLHQPLPKLLSRVLEVSQDDGIPEDSMYAIFKRRGLIGCFSDDPHLSVDYKKYLWKDKK